MTKKKATTLKKIDMEYFKRLVLIFNTGRDTEDGYGPTPCPDFIEQMTADLTPLLMDATVAKLKNGGE